MCSIPLFVVVPGDSRLPTSSLVRVESRDCTPQRVCRGADLSSSPLAGGTGTPSRTVLREREGKFPPATHRASASRLTRCSAPRSTSGTPHAPIPIQPVTDSAAAIERVDRLGGLIHEYRRAA